MCECFIVSYKSRQCNMQVCCHVGLDLTTIQYSSPHSLKWILPQAKSSKNSWVIKLLVNLRCRLSMTFAIYVNPDNRRVKANFFCLVYIFAVGWPQFRVGKTKWILYSTILDVKPNLGLHVKQKPSVFLHRMGLALWVYQKVHNASIPSSAVRAMKIGLKNLLSLSKWISIAFIF